ncbi:MAG TPA: hypothetical protein VGJ13_00915 [Pseudonocardiaceae bacterium]|jgi:hypothetical protein
MSVDDSKDSSEDLRRTRISPALASFATGASTTILTIAATLVSLRSGASQENLFLTLSWIMYVSAACTAVVFGWILLDAIKRSLGELRALSEIEAHVPRLIRFRRRSDKVQVLMDGSALICYECEVESAVGASVPWLTFPIGWGADPDGPEWQSCFVRKVSVDGVDFDPALTLTKRARSRVLNNPRFEHVVLEEAAIRVPVSLEPNRRRCTFVIEIEAPRAYAAIVSATLEEDSYFADIACLTDEIDVRIECVDALRLLCSSRADYRVQASQFSGELLDTTESQVQSASCNMRNGVQWRSTNVKIGYRYEIPISAQRLTG